ncbi:MAG: hypothetical protein R6U57_07565 [Anaerolineales bacterium]
MGLKSRPGKLGLSLLLLLVLVLPLRGAVIDPSLQVEKIRAFSRPLEFDYLSWTVSALWGKVKQYSLGVEGYLSSTESRALVLEYLQLRDEVNGLEEELKNIIADPALEDPGQAAADVREALAAKRSRKEDLAPFIQEIVQRQVNRSLADLGLTWGGQAVPSVLYRAEPDSSALVISPRDVIRQEANIMLVSGLTLDQKIALERDIEEQMDLSALVVGIGGVGMYPAMVIEAGDLNWMLEVIGHEWTHNFLTLRPLGMHYFASDELRTINETVAELAGAEIKRAVLAAYYPERLPPEPVDVEEEPQPEEGTAEGGRREGEEPEAFDFRHEMHITRLKVDRLLEEGNIEEAETYMEERRQFFWDQGYRIRKLNQAYFAFHGSYAAQPGGAAGEEESRLGQNLRGLKEAMPSFSAFMRKVAWMWRLDQFQKTFESELSN